MGCNIWLEYKLSEKLYLNGSCVTANSREYIGDLMQVLL